MDYRHPFTTDVLDDVVAFSWSGDETLTPRRLHIEHFQVKWIRFTVRNAFEKISERFC